MNIEQLTPDGIAEWDQFCEESDEAGFDHTLGCLRFLTTVRPQNQTRPMHFGVRRDGRLLAICPLALETLSQGSRSFQSFSMSGEPLPVPALWQGLSANERSRLLRSIFEHIDALAKSHGVAWARFRLNPLTQRHLQGPMPLPNLLLPFGFLDASIHTQILDLAHGEDALWRDVRKSYRPLIHRASERLSLEVVDERHPDAEKFEGYQRLHQRAAGRVTRPPETFRMMFDWIRQGHAILLHGCHRSQIEVSVLVAVYKGMAYYSSGCVEPGLPQQIAATHWIQWEAIKLLKRRGVRYYNMGWQLFSPQMSHVASADEINIAFFKRGMGGATVPLFRGEKYYDLELFAADMHTRTGLICDYLRSHGAPDAETHLLTRVG